jgi:hypothetical protein
LRKRNLRMLATAEITRLKGNNMRHLNIAPVSVRSAIQEDN